MNEQFKAWFDKYIKTEFLTSSELKRQLFDAWTTARSTPSPVADTVESFTIEQEGTGKPIEVEGETRFIKERDYLARTNRLHVNDTNVADTVEISEVEQKRLMILFLEIMGFGYVFEGEKHIVTGRNVLMQHSSLACLIKRIGDHIERLGQAAGEQVPGWRTIDSAPKNGTKILVLDMEGEIYKARYNPGVGFKYRDQTGNWKPLCGLTHWQPLPAAPELTLSQPCDCANKSDHTKTVFCSRCPTLSKKEE